MNIHYHRTAIPTVYRGIVYRSRLESRMARILYNNNISFIYEKRFMTRNGKGFREVDFFLNKPIEVCWCDFPIIAIEVKGVLTKEAYKQKCELRDVGVKTFIATDGVIRFWTDVAFLKSDFRR